MNKVESQAIDEFSSVFTKQINAIYKQNPLKNLEAIRWSGVVCQPYVFGDGVVDWAGIDELKGKLADLLKEQQRVASM
ncbi:MAG: hypothetical protein IPP41_11900 [Rhodocyclaceae bacterium]|nr:hypothetical protein [Rhodocyclaceae bacterium]